MKRETIMIAGYVIRNLERWSDHYLTDTMGDRPLSVAVTPNGLDFNIQCLHERLSPSSPDYCQVCRCSHPQFRREVVLRRAAPSENDYEISSLETGISK